MKNITIGSLIRNRAWIIPDFLRSILEQDYPKENIAFNFILNDSVDDSRIHLEEFKSQYKADYRYIHIQRLQFDAPVDQRVESVRINIYQNLAIMRNLLLDQAWADKDCYYLFMVDCDHVLPENLLTRLISHNKPYVSALTKTGTNNPNAFNILPRGEDYSLRKDLIEAEVTGGIGLIRREIIDDFDCRCYPLTPLGTTQATEDLLFCQRMRKKGYRLFVDPLAYCEHRMVKK